MEQDLLEEAQGPGSTFHGDCGKAQNEAWSLADLLADHRRIWTVLGDRTGAEVLPKHARRTEGSYLDRRSRIYRREEEPSEMDDLH